jgi:hypothetical protein
VDTRRVPATGVIPLTEGSASFHCAASRFYRRHPIDAKIFENYHCVFGLFMVQWRGFSRGGCLQ